MTAPKVTAARVRAAKAAAEKAQATALEAAESSRLLCAEANRLRDAFDRQRPLTPARRNMLEECAADNGIDKGRYERNVAAVWLWDMGWIEVKSMGHHYRLVATDAGHAKLLEGP